jgi:hypothetical protein
MGLGRYVPALSTMFAQTTEEKLRFAFEICDTDANGVIDQSEFCDLIFNILADVNGSIDQCSPSTPTHTQPIHWRSVVAPGRWTCARETWLRWASHTGR